MSARPTTGLGRTHAKEEHRQSLAALVAAILLQGAFTRLASAQAAPAEAPKPTPSPEPAASKTQHQVEIAGQVVRLRSTATAGWLIMKDDANKPIARFGYTAYTRDGVPDLGRRVVVNDPGYAPPPPSQRVDNAFSVLDVTDLVMIDPIGAGFSKPLGEAKGSDFWGVDQDIRSGAVGFPQVHPGRELRRDAHGGPRLPRAVRARHRPAARAVPAHAGGDRVVPRRDPGQGGIDRGVHGRSRALRLRRVHAGADEGLRDPGRGEGARGLEAATLDYEAGGANVDSGTESSTSSTGKWIRAPSLPIRSGASWILP
jgi:hypothetical protein